MRTWATLLLLWAMAWPAWADKNLSVEQMEEILLKLHGKPDGKVAGELEGVHLTERVSPERLSRWESDFPGKRTQEELMKLADMSAFLNPPASDVLRDPPPDMETQQRMVALAVDYVRIATARLPDFYATRETTHFEDTLSHRADFSYIGAKTMGAEGTLGGLTQTPGADTTTEYRGLHSTGEFTMTVTYRDGHEVLNEDAEKRNQEEEMTRGLISSGEFGPILGKVISDASHTGVSWLRWEQGNGEPAAVFHYAVPANESHFRIGINLGGKQDAVFPAYQGEIKIDPETGQILRLSEVADPTPANGGLRAAIVVDYAPVKIGEQTYICPVRGVAFSMIPVPGGTDESSKPVQVNLNDVAFTHYHEFGSEARIVTNAGPSGENGAPAASGEAGAENAQAAAGANAPAEATGGSAPPATASSANAPSEAAASATPPAAEQAALRPGSNSASTPPTDTKPAEATPGTESAQTSAAAADSSTSAAGSIPESTATEPGLAGVTGGTPTLKVNSRLVVVDVVVRNGDHPVPGLKKSDFAVYEDGVPQTIRDFNPHFAEAAAPAAETGAEPPSLPPGTFTNMPVANTSDSITVLLLDGVNTAPSDVAYVRREMIKFLKAQPPGQRMAVFALGHRLAMLQGFTTNTSQLIATLEKANATSPTSLLPAEEDTFLEREQLANEDVAGVSTQDLANTQNFTGQADANQTGMRMNITLEAIQQLSRYLTGIEGRKNLIWFSGSFPLQFFAVTDIVFNSGSGTQMNPMVSTVGSFAKELKDTADMLVAARVAVYPVDVRGAVTQPMFTSTQQTDYANRVAGPPMSAPGSGNIFAAGQQGAFGTDQQMSEQQIASEHATMDVLAKQTGGRAVYDSNGLQKAMAEALSDGSSYYTLAYVPTNTKYNGAQRNIEVRLTDAKAQLYYRRSYYADADDNAAGAGGDKGLIGAAALLGAPVSTQILFQARVLPEGDPSLAGPMPAKDLKENLTHAFKGAPHRFVTDVAVQLGGLTFAQDADGARSARLEVALVAYDKQGQAVNSLGRQFTLTLPAAQFDQLTASGKGVPVRLALDLPAGSDVVRAVVYDVASARIGSIEIPVDVLSAGTDTSSK